MADGFIIILIKMSGFLLSREHSLMEDLSFYKKDSICTKPSHEILFESNPHTPRHRETYDHRRNEDVSAVDSSIFQNQPAEFHQLRMTSFSSLHNSIFQQSNQVSKSLLLDPSIPWYQLSSDENETFAPRSFYKKRNTVVQTSKMSFISSKNNRSFDSRFYKSRQQSAMHKVFEQCLNNEQWPSQPNENHGNLLSTIPQIQPAYMAPR